MKLNKTIKVGIIAAMAKKALQDEHKALTEKLDLFGDKIYSDNWKKFHGELREALKPSELKKAFKTGINSNVAIQFENEGRQSYDYLQIPRIKFYGAHSESTLVFNSSSCCIQQPDALRTANAPSINGAHYILLDDKHRKPALALKKEIKEFEKKAKKLVGDIEAIVMACTTAAKLIELLPEAEPYIPTAVKPQTNIVPVSMINNVREMMRGAA